MEDWDEPGQERVLCRWVVSVLSDVSGRVCCVVPLLLPHCCGLQIEEGHKRHHRREKYARERCAKVRFAFAWSDVCHFVCPPHGVPPQPLLSC